MVTGALKGYRALSSHSGNYVRIWQPNDNPQQIWSYARIPTEGASPIDVVNSGESPVKLESLVGGGIATQNHFHRGALTSKESGLYVTDNNRIVGTVPAVTALTVRNA